MLPLNRQLKKINQVFRIRSGDFLPKSGMIEGDYNVYGGNGVNGSHNKYNIEGEHIIIGRVGAQCGNVRYINEKIWLTDNAFYISDYLVEIDKKYLSKFLDYQKLGSTSNSSAQPVISYKSIADITIPLPPLPVQHTIVAALDQASASISASRSAIQSQIDALDALWQSRLSEVFENEEYELVKLHDVCNKITDGSHNPPKGIEISDYKMISSRNVDDGILSFDGCRYLTKEDFDLENKRTDIQIGDILLSIVGTIGKVCVIEKQHGKFTMQRSLAVIKPKKEVIDSCFSGKFFQSPILQKFINDNAKGAAQKGIYLNSLKQLKIPLPDLATQTQIVSQLDELSQVLSSLRSAYQSQLQHFDQLRASILDQAFRGELV